MSKADFKWNTQAIEGIKTRFMKGLFTMAFNGIAPKARYNAPYRTGALRNSIRVTEIGDGVVAVVAGGKVRDKTIAYARIHELGGYTGRGYKLYIRPKHYLRNALTDTLREDFSKYFKGVA